MPICILRDGKFNLRSALYILKCSQHSAVWLRRSFQEFIPECRVGRQESVIGSRTCFLDELVHILRISKPKIVFASMLTLKNIMEVAKELEFIKLVVLMDKIHDATSGDQKTGRSDSKLVKSINDLLNPAEKVIPSIPMEKDLPKLDPYDHVAFVLSSSGTTGLPKGVMLTHFNVRSCLNIMEMATIMGVDEGKKVSLGLLPFFHAYGLFVVFRLITLGLKAIVMQTFKPDVLLKAIEKHRITTLTLVPPLLVFLAKDSRVDKYDLSSVSEIICGAAPLGKDTEEKVLSIVNKHRSRVGAPLCTIRQGYGLTESTLGVLTSPSELRKPGSAGFLLPGTQCKVIDLETKKPLGPNKEGELCFRGPLTMKGYMGNTEATASIIDVDGWLHSGDIGYYDTDKHFYIVDRIKELIKYKGFQVAPAELEALLLKHPAIQDAAVIGIPHEEAGEVPKAFVVKEKGTKLSEADVVSFVQKNVSSHKHLRGGVRFVDSIPKTASGKILRRELRAYVKSKM